MNVWIRLGTQELTEAVPSFTWLGCEEPYVSKGQCHLKVQMTPTLTPLIRQFADAPYEYGTADPSVTTMLGTSVTLDHLVSEAADRNRVTVSVPLPAGTNST